MNKDKKISLSLTIIMAVALLIIGIIVGVAITGGFKNKTDEVEPESFSDIFSISEEELNDCLENTDVDSFFGDIEESVSMAMVNVPETQKGTPYSVIVGKNGVKTEIKGALPPEKIRELIDQVKSGEVDSPYTGNLRTDEENDHILGNPEAPIRIISYSDLECSYCALLHSYLTKMVLESEGEIALVFRYWPIHQGSLIKTMAAECIYDLSGFEEYWTYIDAMFALMLEE